MLYTLLQEISFYWFLPEEGVFLVKFETGFYKVSSFVKRSTVRDDNTILLWINYKITPYLLEEDRELCEAIPEEILMYFEAEDIENIYVLIEREAYQVYE